MVRGSTTNGGDTDGDYRIAIIDDHPIIRSGLADLISSQPGLTVCCEAGDVDEAARHIWEGGPDLVVLDLMLGKRNALPFLSELKQRADAPKVLVLTFLPEDVYGERALAAGAEGFVSKDAPSEEVLRGIEALLAGETYVRGELRERLDGTLQSSGTTWKVSLQELTDRELEVFELLGHGLNAKQIASELGISPKTVETHMAHLKEKLSAVNGSDLSRKAILWKAAQA